jgi:hypothetical protein
MSSEALIDVDVFYGYAKSKPNMMNNAFALEKFTGKTVPYSDIEMWFIDADEYIRNKSLYEDLTNEIMMGTDIKNKRNASEYLFQLIKENPTKSTKEEYMSLILGNAKQAAELIKKNEEIKNNNPGTSVNPEQSKLMPKKEIIHPETKQAKEELSNVFTNLYQSLGDTAKQVGSFVQKEFVLDKQEIYQDKQKLMVATPAVKLTPILGLGLLAVLGYSLYSVFKDSNSRISSVESKLTDLEDIKKQLREMAPNQEKLKEQEKDLERDIALEKKVIDLKIEQQTN